MEDLSHDDLIEYALELQRQIDQKEDEIAELTQNQTGKGKGGKRGNFSQKEELEALETENEDLRTQIEAGQLQISDLREQLSNANVKNTTYKNEKVESDKKIKAQAKRLEELEKEIVEVNNRGRSAELQSKEFNKQKSANVKEAQRLWEENETLKEEIKQLEAQMGGLEEEKAFMESLIAKFADEKDDLAAKVDAADVEMEEMHGAHLELEKLLEETQLRLEASSLSEGELEHRISTLEGELRAAQEKAVAENKTHLNETKALKEQIAVLKDSTKVGEKQRALETLQAETADNTKLIEELHTSLESAIHERDLLSEKLLEIEGGIEQRVADRISNERNKAKELALTIESLKAHHADNLEHYATLEQEKAGLVREIDELSSWKAVYEAGHGLQEMSRNQKKLKDDNRRLSVAVEQYNNKLSMVLDANGILTQAFDKLKKEAGKPADFTYPEFALQNEVRSVNASLQYQLRELEEQVHGLETENTKIRSAMKNQAASIGEQGFKYAGMTPDMLLQVNDFATSLREGRVELPLNDRSQALLKENRTLRTELEAQKLRLQSYERELGGAVYSGVVVGGGVGTGADGVNHNADFARLASENEVLHAKMNALQNDLSTLLSNSTAAAANTSTAPSATSTTPIPTPSADGTISVADLSNILIQNNQLMMRELNSLRMSQNTALSNNYTHYTHPAQDTVVQSSGKSNALAAAMGRANQSYNSGGAGVGVGIAGGSTVTFNVPSTPHPAGAGAGGAASGTNNPLWTPSIGRGGMPFSTPHTAGAAGPATPHGKALLNTTLNQLNLPPEEWALDVRDLHTQLVECIEQLYTREQELEDTHAVVATLETNLVSIKQQMTSLYYEYASSADKWEATQSQYKAEASALNNERDDLRLKLRRLSDMSELLQREDKDSIGLQLTELTRKVTIYEVNEAVLSRKYIAQSEQLTQEQHTRAALEADFIEMESNLKKRILYLEQYKLAAGARIGHLQSRVDSSVASSDYIALQAEIDVLREDHLNTLRREVEARMSALSALDTNRELRSARIIIAGLQADLSAATAGKSSAEAELQHQIATTSRALQTAHSSAEISQLVSELARFRGEASRLEVELMAANRRTELLTTRVSEVSTTVENCEVRIQELERRESELSASESAARKAALEMELKYAGGMTRTEAETLTALHDKLTRALDESKRETLRHKELAVIASEQALALQQYKQSYTTELAELREYCTKLESRTDDDLIIGRLQRKLMSTTTSYRAFVRKYQQAREAMRRRELNIKALESRLDEQSNSVMRVQDSSRLEVSALKKALLNLKNTVFEGNTNTATNSTANATNNTNTTAHKANKVKQLARNGFATLTVGSKLVQVSNKVDTLALQASDAVARAAAAEDSVRVLQGQIEDLLCDKHVLEQRTTDLAALVSNKAKQKTLATRLIQLSDDVRTNKIAFLQQRRAVQVLRQEKRHLQSIISNIEADVMELEENKVNSETKKILFDIEDTTEFSSALLGLEEGGLGSGDEGVRRSGDDAAGKRGTTKNTTASTTGPAHRSFDGGAADFPQRQPAHYSNSSGKGVEGAGEAEPSRLSLDMDAITEGQDPRHITPEQLYHKLQVSNSEHAATRRELSDFKLRASTLQNDVSELTALLHEREGHVAYYERVLQQEGLPALIMPHNNNAGGHGNGFGSGGVRRSSTNHTSHLAHPPSNNRPHRLLHEEQEQLQEAASVTIGSLRALLEEKNVIIDRHRATIERLSHAGATSKSRAEKRADDLLLKLENEYQEESRAKRYGVALHPEVFSSGIGGATEGERQHLKHLMSQIEQADSIIQEKDHTLQALEQKLLAEQNTRERAELRCGESLKEMDAMKTDLLQLVQQLNDERAKNKALSATHNTRTLLPTATTTNVPAALGSTNTPASNAKLAEAQKLLKSKEAKLKQYHSIIITLKEEFIKLEAEKAERDVSQLKASHRPPATATSGNSEELRQMSDTIASLRSKLNQCDSDLKKAKGVMESLRQDKIQAVKQCEASEKEAAEALKKMDTAQQGYHRLRKELEDARKKEVRYRERLKDTVDANNTMGMAKDRVEALEREVDVLKAQNAALARNNEEYSKGVGSGTGAGAGGVSGGRTEGGGQLLGTGNGPQDERSRIQAEKWAEDQKLKKRVGVLQSRLAEMQSANEDLQTQVTKGRETLQSALQAKEDLARKVQAGAKAVQDTRRATAEDITELEQAHGRVFSLEEELVTLRRKAHVEQANEIAALSHQISSQRARILELEAELADSEGRRKRAAANSGSGGGGGRSSLREAEDQYHLEQRLRDDADLYKRQKLELEAALLDRDARAIETKFDLESSELEVVRLRRRVKELEQAYKSIATLGGAAGAAAGGVGGVRSAGTGSKKEAELEGVVEAMRRVIDKLKAENDRHNNNNTTTGAAKKGATATGGGGAGGDAFERKFHAEKKRADALEAENTALNNKMKGHEESSQKIVQRQQQVAQLRKQLQSKVDEITTLKEGNEVVVVERETLKRKLSTMQDKINELEISLHKATSGGTRGANNNNNNNSAELAELRERVGAMSTENDSLRMQLHDLRKSMKATTSNPTTTATATAANNNNANTTSNPGVAAELARVKDENARLRLELSAFDIDFFEEIENLKFAHAEAIRKLKMYEQGGAVGGGGGTGGRLGGYRS